MHMHRCRVCGNVAPNGRTGLCGGDKCTAKKEDYLKRCKLCGALDREEKRGKRVEECPHSMSSGIHQYTEAI